MTRALYLHGFASGPQSSKGQFFQARFAEIGRALHPDTRKIGACRGPRLELPDLTESDFEHSTLSQQLKFLESFVGRDRVLLMGSSMGGYLAALFAARHAEHVAALVLLAPAFGLAHRWSESLDPAVMREWRERGSRAVYHYGEKRERRISYDLIADGLQYEEFPDVRQPCLVFHGRRDASVDYRLSESFAAGRPNVELVLYDSDHQLLDVLEPMWSRIGEFVAR